MRRPWWQRGWVDVALFGLTLYGFYLLRQQGSILALGAGGDDRSTRGTSARDRNTARALHGLRGASKTPEARPF